MFGARRFGYSFHRATKLAFSGSTKPAFSGGTKLAFKPVPLGDQFRVGNGRVILAFFLFLGPNLSLRQGRRRERMW